MKSKESVGTFKKFFKKINSQLADNVRIPEEMKKQAVILSDKEIYTKAKPGSEVFLKWVIVNKANCKWEKSSMLKN